MNEFISGLALVGAAGCLIILIKRADSQIETLNKKLTELSTKSVEKEHSDGNV